LENKKVFRQIKISSKRVLAHTDKQEAKLLQRNVQSSMSF